MKLAAVATLLDTTLQTQSLAGPVADQALFTQLESQWNDAHIKGDATTLERLWADDLQVIVPRMTPLSKTEALTFARSGHMRFLRYETSELSVRVYADTAIVMGRVRRSREGAGQVLDDHWRFIKVYVRTEGQWRVVAYQASEVGP